MLRRLLIFFALLLALPATARPVCHDAGAMQQRASAGAHHVGAHTQATHGHDNAGGAGHAAYATAHDCLGCIPPDMLLGACVECVAVPRAPAQRTAPPAFPAGAASAPTPPPPKNA